MRLDERHYRAIEMTLSGAKRQAIAEALGVSGHTIYSWNQDADFQAELQRIRDELASQVKDVVAANLREHVPNALAKIITLASGAQSEKVQLAASQDVLDRAGFGAVQKHHSVIEMKFPPGTLELAQAVLNEMNARTIESIPQGEQPEEPVLLQ